MPYTQSNDADATSRVFLARDLMNNFRFIMSGYWAPIHQYFIALSLIIIPDNVYGPMILSMLFAVASCIPLYFFTKNEFNKQGALFVALIYTLSPVVFKNSFMAMAEVCYAFFVLLSMYFLSKGIRSQQKIKYAIYAGLSITIAGGIRYEAWEVSALFFLVLVLFKQWKMLISYGLTAVIFPVYWLIGSQIEQKDFLYSFRSVTSFITASGYNNNITKAELVKRLFFFPISWALMLTPFISIIFLLTFFKKIFTKKVNKSTLIWLFPFFAILITFIYNSYKGTLCAVHRFSITLVLLSIPFFAIFFENEKRLRFKKTLTIILIALMIPFSFCWQKLPFYKLTKLSYTLSYVLENSFKEEEAIPLINDDAMDDAILGSIKYQLNEKSGLILDFIGWDNTYYIALKTQLPIRNIYLYNIVYQKIDTVFLTKFFNEFPKGLIVIKAFSPFDKICHSVGALMEIENIPINFYLEKCLDINNIKLFRYYTKPKEWSVKYKSENPNLEGITKTIKNVVYYEYCIRSNSDWLKDVERKAKTRNLSLDEMISIDAQWMVDRDLINTKKR